MTEWHLFLMLTMEFFAQSPHAAEQDLAVAADELRPAGQVGVEALDPPVVERQDVILDGLDQEEPLQLGKLLWVLFGDVSRLRPVIGSVQFPDVLIEGRELARCPMGMLCRVTAVHPLW